MPRGGQNKKGLRVGHSVGLVKARPRGTGTRLYEKQPDAWYVYVYVNSNGVSEWRAILGLAFIRQKDAQRAAESLTAAGYDSYRKLKTADALQVKAIACEHLQW